jgi:hypothetical protein
MTMIAGCPATLAGKGASPRSCCHALPQPATHTCPMKTSPIVVSGAGRPRSGPGASTTIAPGWTPLGTRSWALLTCETPCADGSRPRRFSVRVPAALGRKGGGGRWQWQAGGCAPYAAGVGKPQPLPGTQLPSSGGSKHPLPLPAVVYPGSGPGAHVPPSLLPSTARSTPTRNPARAPTAARASSSRRCVCKARLARGSGPQACLVGSAGQGVFNLCVCQIFKEIFQQRSVAAVVRLACRPRDFEGGRACAR